MDDAFDGVEDGMGDSRSSYTVVAVVKVLVEDMLGRERSSRASLGLSRVSGTEAEGKCPRTVGRHRHIGASGCWASPDGIGVCALELRACWPVRFVREPRSAGEDLWNMESREGLREVEDDAEGEDGRIDR